VNTCSKSVYHFNKIPDIKINIEKVKLWHKIGLIYEICAYNKVRYKKVLKEEIEHIWNALILPKLKTIDANDLNSYC